MMEDQQKEDIYIFFFFFFFVNLVQGIFWVRDLSGAFM